MKKFFFLHVAHFHNHKAGNSFKGPGLVTNLNVGSMRLSPILISTFQQ